VGLAAALAAATQVVGCDSSRACKQGTLLVAVHFRGAALAADSVTAAVTIGGSTPAPGATASHTPGTAEGTIEIGFPGGYPTAERVDVTLTASASGATVASATGTVATLPVVCGNLSITLGAAGPAGAAGAGGAGGGGAVGAGGTVGGGGAVGTGGTPPPTRQVDLLFMIDNSSSMDTGQANLRANLPSFMNVLKGLPGGLPDLHVAVVSSDMGAGDGSSIMGCSFNGDNGVFRSQPTGGCTTTGLNAGATFLTDTGGASPQTNFGTQDITSVFQCIAALGATGCGFEHQLASIARALGADGAAPPTQNAGFLRPNAILAIVLLTNEDDCSAPPGSTLFTPTSSQLGSMYGPTENFQCNEWGHKCLVPAGLPNAGTMAPPSRYAPTNSVTDRVVYTPPMAATSNCVSREDSPVLTPVGTVATGIKRLKAFPNSQILVTAITGLNEGPSSNGYAVTWRAAPTTDTGPWPAVAHACGGDTASTSFADPAVRIEQFVQQFGTNGFVDTYCQTTYAGTLGLIATKLAAMLTP
jgi:hypothetical protein